MGISVMILIPGFPPDFRTLILNGSAPASRAPSMTPTWAKSVQLRGHVPDACRSG
jgi:hypothetical protein